MASSRLSVILELPTRDSRQLRSNLGQVPPVHLSMNSEAILVLFLAERHCRQQREGEVTLFGTRRFMAQIAFLVLSGNCGHPRSDDAMAGASHKSFS
jgi:hypothetical protein